jgi:hypothetical protein
MDTIDDVNYLYWIVLNNWGPHRRHVESSN